jgi:hypothetical protein
MLEWGMVFLSFDFENVNAGHFRNEGLAMIEKESPHHPQALFEINLR